MGQETTHVPIMVFITAILLLVILKDVYIIAHIYTVFSFETAVDLSMDVRFKTPANFYISGQSQCGKSYLVRCMLYIFNELFDPVPYRIIYLEKLIKLCHKYFWKVIILIIQFYSITLILPYLHQVSCDFGQYWCFFSFSFLFFII